MAEGRYLTVRETSKFLKVSISTLNRLIRQKEIPSYKIDHRRLFDKDKLIEWVRAQRSDGQINTGNINSDSMTFAKRCCDRHEGLSPALQKLRTTKERDRDNIVEAIKKIISKSDPDFIDNFFKKLPLNLDRRRWYDRDVYLWLVLNSLCYADDQTIKEVVRFINSK